MPLGAVDFQEFATGIVWFFGVFIAMHIVSHAISVLTCGTFRTLPASDKMEWNQRVVAAVFSVSIFVYLAEDENRTNYDNLWLYSISYTLYDFACCLLDEKALTLAMKVHHLVMGTLLLFQYATKFSPAVACTLLRTEGSTPFLQMRYFLFKVGLEKHPSYVINGLLLWSTFAYFRIYSIPVAVYGLVSDATDLPPSVKFPAIAMGIGLFVMNLFWFFLISQKLVQVVWSAIKPSKSREELKQR